MAELIIQDSYAPTISIIRPKNGDANVDLSGNPNANGTAAANTTMMAYQIDSNPPVTLTFTAGGGGAQATWTLDLVAAGCTAVNTWYTLTIFAWSPTGQNSVSSTFQRTS
jgi:hypothetical protein